VDSTNNWLKAYVSKSAPVAEGTVIMAEEQFAGRGQAGNTWISRPGENLTMSVLLNPGFIQPSEQFRLNKAVSLAVSDVLQRYLPGIIKIKWPNDLYAGDQKIGGILIENMLQGNRIKHAIIGIGLNINQLDFDKSLNNVTSLRKILHIHYDISNILTEICAAIEARYLQLRAGRSDRQDEDYLSMLYAFGREQLFEIDGKITTGIIRGITPAGRLIIDTPVSANQSFGFKEIKFII
jgi:BirA family biotin operon repressor/biotin-[acetyl-CoA-carboxylase] ligase